jgi:hypothetical protein
MEKQLNTKRASARPRRTPLVGRNRLALRDRDPNYQYRLVNANLDSDPDRVQMMLDLGYEIVPRQVVGQTGDKQVDQPSALGSAGQISVGQGTKAVWMRIPKEDYLEDQAMKQEENDRIEQRPSQSADYGKVSHEVRRTPD